MSVSDDKDIAYFEQRIADYFNKDKGTNSLERRSNFERGYPNNPMLELEAFYPLTNSASKSQNERVDTHQTSPTCRDT